MFKLNCLVISHMKNKRASIYRSGDVNLKKIYAVYLGLN